MFYCILQFKTQFEMIICACSCSVPCVVCLHSILNIDVILKWIIKFRLFFLCIIINSNSKFLAVKKTHICGKVFWVHAALKNNLNVSNQCFQHNGIAGNSSALVSAFSIHRALVEPKAAACAPRWQTWKSWPLRVLFEVKGYLHPVVRGVFPLILPAKEKETRCVRILSRSWKKESRQILQDTS